MPIEVYRDFRIEPAPLKLRYHGVARYKARAFVSPNGERDRRHCPVTEHDRLFDSQDAALQRSLMIARRWIDAKVTVCQCADRKDVGNVRREPPDLPFTHRATDALKAPWQQPGGKRPRRLHFEFQA